MVRKGYILFAAALIYGCQAKEAAVEIAGPGLPAGAEVTPYSDSPALGHVRSLDTQGKPLVEGTAQDGQRAGSWVEYYPSGKPRSISSYVAGNLEGPYVEFTDNNGQILVRAWYHNGQLHGDYTVYNYGTVKEERHYQNGKLEGPLKKYYDNGTLLEESNYTDGVINGMAKWYDQQGNVTIEYEYRDGKLVQ